MRSGDRPGLQNRRAAGLPVAGGFDPHSLPPGFGGLRTLAIILQSVCPIQRQTDGLLCA